MIAFCITMLFVLYISGWRLKAERKGDFHFRCSIGRHYIGWFKSRPHEGKFCLRCGKVWLK